MSLAGSATKWHALFTEWLIRTIGPSRIGGNPVQYRKTATHRISASALEPPAPVPQPTAIAAHRRRKHGKEQRRASGRAPGPCWGLDDGPKEKTDGLLPALVMPKAELLRARTNAPVLGFHAHRYLRLPTWVPTWHRHKSEPTSPRGASTRSSSSTSQVASLSGLESVPAPGSAHSRRPQAPAARMSSCYVTEEQRPRSDICCRTDDLSDCYISVITKSRVMTTCLTKGSPDECWPCPCPGNLHAVALSSVGAKRFWSIYRRTGVCENITYRNQNVPHY